MKMKTIGKAALIITACAVLNACAGSIYEKETVGIGRDISELKRSPCACMLLKLPANLPDWMTAAG